MGIEWFLTAQIKISESAYYAWLAADINFNFEVTFINPMQAAPDPIIGAISDFGKEKIKISAASFFAEELLHQHQNASSSVFHFRYDKENLCFNFAISLKTLSDFQISKTLAALLSIVEFKNIEGCDMCIVSKSDFQNVRYINELYQKNVIIMPKVTSEYFIPQNLESLYKLASETKLSLQEKISLIDGELLAEFKNIVSRQLAPGIEEILKKSTEEQPSVITENSLFKTDGKNVLSSDGSIVEEADPHSFKSLGGYYAADANNVYYDSQKINNADPDSFTVLHWDYAKDKFNAYFMGRPVCSLDKGDFKALRPAYGYAANSETVFYLGKPIEGSDPASFHAVGEGRQNDSVYFGADKNNVYFEGAALPHMDPRSFEHIGKHFFKDAKHVYVDSDIIEGCSPATVKALNNYYIADNFEAYFIYEGNITRLQSSDVKNLKVSGFIAADSVNVYYQGLKIEGADGATAEIFDKNNDGYITDKSRVFYCDEQLPADRKTFRTLGFGYAADKEKVFFRSSIVPKADPETFVPTSYGSASDKFSKFSFAKPITKNIKADFRNITGDYFKDEKNIYYKNAIVKDADYDSFRPMESEKDEDIIDILASHDEKSETGGFSAYAKDTKHVYFEGRVIKGADPRSFKIIFRPKTWAQSGDNTTNNLYAKDSNNVYYLGKAIVGANPGNFKAHEIENLWEEGGKLYHNGKPLNYIDSPTFSHLEYGFYKDSAMVYYGFEPLEGLMPENLTIISPNYIKDEVFFCYVKKGRDGKITKTLFEADSNSFDLIDFNSAFSYDRFGLFFEGRRIEDIDIGNIAYLDDNYLKDSANIFCGNIKLQDIDVDNFAPLGSGYATDGKISFYQALRLGTTKPIHVLGSGYATDGETFWLYGEEIGNPQDDMFLRETLGVIL